MRVESKTAFRVRVEQAIQQNLNNTNFSLNALMREMGMGRTFFFLKFRMAFGTTPNNYIRIARLERSAQLLRQKSLAITQIALYVGFSSVAYYTKCFREHYGITPTEFQKRG